MSVSSHWYPRPLSVIHVRYPLAEVFLARVFCLPQQLATVRLAIYSSPHFSYDLHIETTCIGSRSPLLFGESSKQPFWNAVWKLEVVSPDKHGVCGPEGFFIQSWTSVA